MHYEMGQFEETPTMYDFSYKKGEAKTDLPESTRMKSILDYLHWNKIVNSFVFLFHFRELKSFNPSL